MRRNNGFRIELIRRRFIVARCIFFGALRSYAPRVSTRALAGVLAALMIDGCSGGSTPSLVSAIGDPERGSLIVERHACGSCHEIPDRLQADGLAGPPLTHFASRTTIAGLLPNTPTNLVRWLRSPQEVVPGNAMPDLGLTEQEARDVAAYLYTLR